MHIPDDWHEATERIVAAGDHCVVMVIGASDVGKSSFCAHLASQLQRAGRRTGVIDGDIGQSSIGPPTVIGAGFVPEALEGLRQVQLSAGYFVGNVTPLRHLLPCVVGARRMLSVLQHQQAQAVVVDTTGLVSGGAGTALKLHKFDLLRPTHTVVIQRHGEIAHLADQWRPVRWTKLCELQAPAAARQRSRQERRDYRTRRFRELFKARRELSVNLDRVRLRSTLLFQGTRLSPDEYEWLAEPLGSEIVHARRLEDRVLLVTRREPYRSGVATARGALDVRSVFVVPVGQFVGLVVGLLDDDGEWFSLALIRDLDFEGGKLTLIVPGRLDRRVSKIVFGDLWLHPDGREMDRGDRESR